MALGLAIHLMHLEIYIWMFFARWYDLGETQPVRCVVFKNFLMMFVDLFYMLLLSVIDKLDLKELKGQQFQHVLALCAIVHKIIFRNLNFNVFVIAI